MDIFQTSLQLECLFLYIGTGIGIGTGLGIGYSCTGTGINNGYRYLTLSKNFAKVIFSINLKPGMRTWNNRLTY